MSRHWSILYLQHKMAGLSSTRLKPWVFPPEEVIRGWALLHYTEFVRYSPTVWRKLNCADNEKIPIGREDCKTWAKNFVKQLHQIEVDDNEAEAILIGRARVIEAYEYSE